MAYFGKVSLKGTTLGGDEVDNDVDSEGHLEVSVFRPKTAFGEVETAEPTPIIQIDAVYGLLTTDTETFTGASSGTATASDGLFVCTTGTGLYGYGVVRSLRDARYRPGQGLLGRFTAMFTSGVSSSLQQAGFFSAENSLCFGYNGTSFGILRGHRGALEIRTLTLTVAASGAENATITLNGSATVVALTAGTTAFNAFQIASASFGTGWNARQVGNTVIFTATAVGAKAGAFSFASTGTAAGSIAATRTGAAVTEVWTPQSEWSVDKMDGEGPSGMTLDPTKLNVYEIVLQYLGGGNIEFSVENPEEGQQTIVHRIEYAGNYTQTSLRNPSMKLGWAAASLGSTTDLTVSGASANASVQGKKVRFRNPFGLTNTKGSIGATVTSVLAIRSGETFGAQVNFRESYPTRLGLASEGTGAAPTVYYVYLGSTLGGTPNWTYYGSTVSAMEYDTAGTTVSGGRLITTATTAKTGNTPIDLAALGVVLGSKDVLIIAASTSSGSATVTASLTWDEE